VPLPVIAGDALLAGAALGLEPQRPVTVNGRTLSVAGSVGDSQAEVLLADIGLAAELLGSTDDALSQVGLAVRDPWARWRQALDRLMPGISAGLPAAQALPLTALLPGVDADRKWQAVPVVAQRPNAAFARSVLFNLGALGTLALVVAWFLIYQVAVIWLRRQAAVFARLHALGVSRGELRMAFLGILTGLGVLATALGIAIGWPLAGALVRLATQGLPDAAPPLVLDGWLLLKAAGSGLGVCMVGAVAAFARSSVPDGWRPTTGWRRLWPMLPGLLVIVGIGVDSSGVIGAFAAIAGLCLLALAAVPPLLAGLRRLSMRAGGPWLLRLALRDVVWYPRVLGVALAALALAVATGIGIGLMVDSFRLDFSRMLTARLAGDLYVSELGDDFQAVERWLGAQPEVRSLRAAGTERVLVSGVAVDLGYAHFDALESARYGHAGALAADQVLLSEGLARRLDVGRGGRISVDGARLTVAGTFPGYGEAVGRALVDAAALPALGRTLRYDRLTVIAGSSAAAGPAPLGALEERLLAAFPGVRVASPQAVRAQSLTIFDRTFAITRALTLLALAVAAVGIYNALTALRLQQAPTLALLHAQGLSRAEAWQIGVLRCAVVGGAAVLVAWPLGVAMAWTLCAVVNPRSFGWTVPLALPPAGWAVPLLLGLATALLAGMLPAPRERGAMHEAA
jgi:putative ABC transport system permease protein